MPEQDSLFEVPQAARTDGWIYVIGVPGSSVAKIGWSANPDNRLRYIQTSSPERLAVLWKAPGSQRLERALHASFSELRQAGEWFDFGANDPVAQVSEVASRLGTDEPVPPITEPISVDRSLPPSDDPDRGHPDYQPDEWGCRQATPTEIRAQGGDPKATTILLCRCGMDHFAWRD